MSQTNARFQQGGVILPRGSSPGNIGSGESALILDIDGSVKLQAPDGSKASIGGGGTTLEAYALGRAQLFVPTANIARAWMFDGSQPDPKVVVVSGGACTSSLSTVAGGALVVDSSGTANSAATVYAPVVRSGATPPPWTLNQRTGLYYLRFRAKFGSVGDAQTVNTMGLTNVTGGATQTRLGISGAVSTANFTYAITDNAAAVQHSGSLGVAIETASFHTFEVWNNAGAMAVACDEGTAVQFTNTLGGQDPGCWLINAVNGTTAASRSVTVANIVTVGVMP